MAEYLSTREACSLYGIAPSTLWRWVNKGKIIQYKDPISKRNYFKPIAAPNYVSVKEACFRLRIARSTLYKYMVQGLISPVLNQPRTVFSIQELERFEKEKFQGLVKIQSVDDLRATRRVML